jgi:glycosyltransferase involved in cell wall biosynthesis
MGYTTANRNAVAVVIPCLNEEASVSRVVRDFKRELPDAMIYVIDNGSTDATIVEAKNSGAIVISQTLRGKGNAMRKAFAVIDADIFVMVDGDGTYDPSSVKEMVSIIEDDRADLVIANRTYSVNSTPQRTGHVVGNRLFSWIVRRLFSLNIDDVLSGYRAMSRRFVKSLPLMSRGFEIEVELSAHASLLRVEVEKVESSYFNRESMSTSKLRTVRDGLRIALAVFRIFRSFAPARFFGTLSGLSLLTSVILQTSIVDQTSTVESASIALVVICVVFFTIGVVLSSQSRIQRQILRLAYISGSSAK